MNMNMLKNNEQNEKEIRKFKIYVHINKHNGKLYIGQTCKDERFRWNNRKGYIGCHHFWNAIQKDGWNSFNHIVLFEVNSQELTNISEEFINALKNYGIKHNQKQVICLNDLTIYDSLSKAGKSKNVSEGKISRCCNKKANYAGNDEKLGKLLWEFYNETKQYKISKYIPKNLKQCKCLTTNKVFTSTQEASDEYAINKNTIAWVCNPNNKNNKTNGGNTGYGNLY